jgi:hypothetical protein
LAGELQGGPTREQQWLGRVLSTWLSTGGELQNLLGVKPPQGSRRTAQALVEQDKHDQALLRLAAAVGSRAEAARILAGRTECPALLAELVVEAQSGAVSQAAFTRAQRRAARHHT